jgi:lysophospholipase L1-like esterase
VHIRQYAPAVRARYVDLWPALGFGDGELDPTLSDDRLHLGAEGETAVRAALAPVLAERVDVDGVADGSADPAVG